MKIMCKVREFNASDTLVECPLVVDPAVLEMFTHLVRKDIGRFIAGDQRVVTFTVDVEVHVVLMRRGDGLLGETAWNSDAEKVADAGGGPPATPRQDKGGGTGETE